MIRRNWQVYSFTKHNTYCRQKGYTAAIIEPWPWRRRVRPVLRSIRDELRESVALRIAPWLNPDE